MRSGPYRVLRHPIYTAMIGMFVGSAIAIGEWHSLLGVALIIIAYVRKIPMEERRCRCVRPGVRRVSQIELGAGPGRLLRGSSRIYGKSS